MREILFRGKRVIDGKWSESCCPLGEMHSGTVTYDFDQKTVCQYTGLTDKNGKKIFEGDIVCLPKCENDIAVFALDGCNYFLKGKCSNYSIGKYLGEKDCECYEVIGNIFDNPELIGEQPWHKPHGYTAPSAAAKHGQKSDQTRRRKIFLSCADCARMKAW